MEFHLVVTYWNWLLCWQGREIFVNELNSQGGKTRFFEMSQWKDSDQMKTCRNPRPGHLSLLDGHVKRKLWRKNYQEANSKLKITEGLEHSLSAAFTQEKFYLFWTLQSWGATRRRRRLAEKLALIFKACGSFPWQEVWLVIWWNQGRTFWSQFLNIVPK